MDHAGIFETVCVMVKNLNAIIDRNEYPNSESKLSNMLNRPLGIGIQGLADLYFQMRIPFDSKEANQINKELFETMYYAALWVSSEMAREQYNENKRNSITCAQDKYYSGIHDNIKNTNTCVCDDVVQGQPCPACIMPDEILPGYYPSYYLNGGCPYSKGVLQYHMWGKTNEDNTIRWDWKSLIQKIQQHGLRNSQLLALMPTASTSQILGNNECFEPVSSNIYTRKTLAGEFIVGNKYLFEDLLKMELLTPDVINNIIENNGSIQYIESDKVDLTEIKKLYKTAWELKMKDYINQNIVRSCYIDQSSSMSLWMEHPTIRKLSSMLFYGWKNGLKTGSYYIRSRAPASAQKYFKIDEKPSKNRVSRKPKTWTCTEEICTSCSG